MGRISKLDLSVISNLNYIKQSNISNISNFNTLVKNFRDNYINVSIKNNFVSGNYQNFSTDSHMGWYLMSNLKGNLTSFSFQNTNNTQTTSLRNSVGYGYSLSIAASDGFYISSEDRKTYNKVNSYDCIGIYNGLKNLILLTSSGIYYGRDPGNLTKSNSFSTIQFDTFIIGPDLKTLIVGSVTSGLYYSNDDGATWNASNITNTRVNSISIFGNRLLAGTNAGIYYSDNNGKTWTLSNVTNTTICQTYVIGSTAIACLNGKGIYTSSDGKTFTQTVNDTTTPYNGLNAIRNTRTHDKPYTIIIGTGRGIFYSHDYCKTVKQSNISSGNFNTIQVVGDTLLGVNYDSKELYYSNDFGQTWNKDSNITGIEDISALDPHLGLGNIQLIFSTSTGLKYLDLSGKLSLTDEAQKAYDILYNQSSWKNEDITNNPILADAFLKYLGYYPSISPNVLPPNINSSTPTCYSDTNTYRGQTGSNAIIKWDNKVKENYDENGVLKLGNAPYFEFAEKYSTKTKTYEKYGGGGGSDNVKLIQELIYSDVRPYILSDIFRSYWDGDNKNRCEYPFDVDLKAKIWQLWSNRTDNFQKPLSFNDAVADITNFETWVGVMPNSFNTYQDITIDRVTGLFSKITYGSYSNILANHNQFILYNARIAFYRFQYDGLNKNMKWGGFYRGMKLFEMDLNKIALGKYNRLFIDSKLKQDDVGVNLISFGVGTYHFTRYTESFNEN